MKLLIELSKLGILVSFLIAIIYEITGMLSLKFASIIIGVSSLSILIYSTTNEKIDREVLYYIKLLK